MDSTLQDVLKFIEDEDAKFIRLAFRDAFGVNKNISVMPGEIKKAFEQGIPINARKVRGFEDADISTLYLRPDATTLSILPWRPESGRVLRMYCDICDEDGTPIKLDTRWLLKEAVLEAEKAGIEFRFASESEFYLFSKDEQGNSTRIPFDRAGYMDVAPLDRCENIRREICLTIERMGLTPERSHHEFGHGQNEIDFHYAKPLKAADQMTTFKNVVSTLADKYGLVADFSPMPVPEEPGNGYHINIYAVDSEGNDVAEYAATGIMEKIRDITLFLNPTAGSYARLMSSDAEEISGGDESSTELMTVSSFAGRTHAELRSPDASGNPYLMYALLIYAGLEGIKAKKNFKDYMRKDFSFLPNSKKAAVVCAEESEFVKQRVPQEILAEYKKA